MAGLNNQKKKKKKTTHSTADFYSCRQSKNRGRAVVKTERERPQRPEVHARELLQSLLGVYHTATKMSFFAR